MRLGFAFFLAMTLGLPAAGCELQEQKPPQGEGKAPRNASPYPTGRLDRSHAGTPAPDAPIEDGSGAPARLSDLRGRPLLVNLWATWCAPCIVEMPSLDRLAARQGAVRVLALSQDTAGREPVEAFFDERGFTRLEPWIDPELRVMTTLGIDTLPTTILYDSRGREVWRMTGLADWESTRVRRLLHEAG